MNFGILPNEIQFKVFSYVNDRWSGFDHHIQKKDEVLLMVRGYDKYQEISFFEPTKLPTISYLMSLPPIIVFQWIMYDSKYDYHSSIITNAIKKNISDETILTYIEFGFKTDVFHTDILAKYKRWNLLKYYIENEKRSNLFTPLETLKHGNLEMIQYLFKKNRIEKGFIRTLMLQEAIKMEIFYLEKIDILNFLKKIFDTSDFDQIKITFYNIKQSEARYTWNYFHPEKEVYEWWWNNIETWSLQILQDAQINEKNLIKFTEKKLENY